MKLLLSGFTQRMTNSSRLRYDYLTSVFVLRDALKLLGHDVDHRAVTPGEDLSGYDRALIGIGPTKSFTARFVPGSAWVYNQLPGRVILYCDDWSIEKTGYDFRNTLSRWDKWVKFFTDAGPVKGQELEGHDDRLADVNMMLEDITRTPVKKLLAPMFPWGDHQLLMKDNLPSTLVPWDPTPLIKTDVITEPAFARERRWVLATLQKKLNLPKGSWPIEQVGNKREGQPYVSESDVLLRYRQSWGVICPPYQRAGSGWWRARYQHAADAGCVLWLDPRDKQGTDISYRLSLTDYEKLTDDELTKVTAEQRASFYANTATREKTLQVINEALS